MGRQFHDQLEALRRRTVEMAEMARANLIEGTRSLVEQDHALARKVIDREDLLNRIDVEIERDALDLLALNQPVAQDLRTVGATLKIITYLDRIGRYGYDIAKVTLETSEAPSAAAPVPALTSPGQPAPRKPVSFTIMADHAMAMLDEAMEAYKARDAAKARAVNPKDEVVDALYEQVFRDCVTRMMEDPRAITTAAHHILVARHLERAADNASKIAEKALYMVTGERRLHL